MINFNSKIFLNRLFDLLDKDHRKKGEFYEYIGSAGIVQNWKNRGSAPQSDKLLAIAQYFNVSTDYLLGLSDNPNQKTTTYPLPKKQELLHFESPEYNKYGVSNPEVQEMLCQVRRIYSKRGHRDVDKMRLFLSTLDPGLDIIGQDDK